MRAITGFTRVEPNPVAAEDVAAAIAQGDVAQLSKAPRNWLPAAEIRGEGIFLRFDTAAIDAWIAANPGVAARAAAIDGVAAAAAARRGRMPDHAITPRLLLVHGFAHALIRQISVECGYSASALRERLYVTEATEDAAATNGVLIYTGSPDSEGSLGGLVRLAAPGMLGPIIMRTLAAAGWCGSDPVCLETDPVQAGDRLSGAACHCCLLLPETACERFNRELDRAVLVGDADGSFSGFFGDAEPPWDALVVDEAQDILTPAHLDTLDLLVRDGLEAGTWHMFVDPNQNLYSSDVQHACEERLAAGRPVFERLEENCRNTRQVAAQASITSGIDLPTAGAPEGPECDLTFYGSRADGLAKLDEAVAALLDGEVRPDDIVVLSTRQLANSLLAGTTSLAGRPVADLAAGPPPAGAIAFSTMHGFKGLDRMAVVAIDMGEIGDPLWSMLHYAGLSRARCLLRCLVPEPARRRYARQAAAYGQRLKPAS